MAFDWKDVGGKIAEYAPQVGGLIGSIVPGAGPVAGTGVGMAIKAVAGLFGLADNATADQIMQAVQNDPQAALKLKTAEMDFVLKQRDQDLEKMRIDIENIRAKNETYIKELDTKTLPWVDAVHKMGRQLLNIFNLVAVVWLMLAGKTISPEVVLLLGGPNVAYQLIKGKGQESQPKPDAPL